MLNNRTTKLTTFEKGKTYKKVRDHFKRPIYTIDREWIEKTEKTKKRKTKRRKAKWKCSNNMWQAEREKSPQGHLGVRLYIFGMEDDVLCPTYRMEFGKRALGVRELLSITLVEETKETKISKVRVLSQVVSDVCKVCNEGVYAVGSCNRCGLRSCRACFTYEHCQACGEGQRMCGLCAMGTWCCVPEHI